MCLMFFFMSNSNVELFDYSPKWMAINRYSTIRYKHYSRQLYLLLLDIGKI